MPSVEVIRLFYLIGDCMPGKFRKRSKLHIQHFLHAEGQMIAMPPVCLNTYEAVTMNAAVHLAGTVVLAFF